jgi:hypothetical protein
MRSLVKYVIISFVFVSLMMFGNDNEVYAGWCDGYDDSYESYNTESNNNNSFKRASFLELTRDLRHYSYYGYSGIYDSGNTKITLSATIHKEGGWFCGTAIDVDYYKIEVTNIGRLKIFLDNKKDNDYDLFIYKQEELIGESTNGERENGYPVEYIALDDYVYINIDNYLDYGYYYIKIESIKGDYDNSYSYGLSITHYLENKTTDFIDIESSTDQGYIGALWTNSFIPLWNMNYDFGNYNDYGIITEIDYYQDKFLFLPSDYLYDYPDYELIKNYTDIEILSRTLFLWDDASREDYADYLEFQQQFHLDVAKLKQDGYNLNDIEQYIREITYESTKLGVVTYITLAFPETAPFVLAYEIIDIPFQAAREVELMNLIEVSYSFGVLDTKTVDNLIEVLRNNDPSSCEEVSTVMIKEYVKLLGPFTKQMDPVLVLHPGSVVFTTAESPGEYTYYYLDRSFDVITYINKYNNEDLILVEYTGDKIFNYFDGFYGKVVPINELVNFQYLMYENEN